MGLPKDGADHLVSALKEKGNSTKRTKSSVYRNREQNFRKCFHFYQELSLVYCTNVNELINKLKPGVNKNREWRLFIDSSKRSPKAVLLHDTNEYTSIHFLVISLNWYYIWIQQFEIYNKTMFYHRIPKNTILRGYVENQSWKVIFDHAAPLTNWLNASCSVKLA